MAHRFFFFSFACKFHKFFVFWNGNMAAWVVCALSAERLAAVWFPMKTKEWTSKRKMTVLLLILATCQAILDAHYFWTIHLIHAPSGGYKCTDVKQFRTFLSYYWPWINLTVYSVLPFIILISSSCAIIAKIAYITYQKKKKLTNTDRSSKVSSITITLLFLSFTFVLTTLPIVGYRLSVNNWIDVDFTALDWARDGYRWAIFAHVNWLNNSCNVFLYVVLSPIFRKQLLSVCKGMRSNSSRVNPA